MNCFHENCLRLILVLLNRVFLYFQESIAYFPLVILISGVFSSLGAKKLDKILGAKVTILLGFELNQTSFSGSASFLFLKVLETNFREVNMGSAECKDE